MRKIFCTQNIISILHIAAKEQKKLKFMFTNSKCTRFIFKVNFYSASTELKIENMIPIYYAMRMHFISMRHVASTLLSVFV